MSNGDQWIEAYFYKCIRRSGEHILVGGATGTGKTQMLYDIADCITTMHKKETIVWFDTGKASELLILAQEIKPVKVFIPEGKSIRFPDTMKEKISVAYFSNADAIFDQIDPNRINVLCIEPYFPDAKEYLKILLDFFSVLIHRAYEYKLPVPMAIFIDEIQGVAPGQGHALSKKHNEAGVQMQRNIERLRALEVRIVGATQDWTKLRKGVRQSFTWLIVKRGMYFSHFDKPNLAKYNGIFGHLKTDEMIIVTPDNFFSPTNTVKFYGNGKSLGKVFYLQHSDEGKMPEEKEIVAP